MNTESPDILKRILETKRQEIIKKQANLSLMNIEQRARACTLPLRGFRAAIEARVQQSLPAVIAELKKASPSKGLIRQDFDLFALARSYVRGNATCLSVLTDQEYFQGHDTYLTEVRDTVDIPLLRKDFIIDPYQVFESRLLGADAILLIAAALPITELEALCQLAISLDLDVLIEVHSKAEFDQVAHLAVDALIGVNNRNLQTFEVDTQITYDIVQSLKPGQWCITESGISDRKQVQAMLSHGVFGFLIGEALMRHEKPEEGLRSLFPELAEEA